MARKGSGATIPPGTMAPPEAVSRGQVLVVDDDVPTARGFGRILTSAGFSVTIAHDGAEDFHGALENQLHRRFELGGPE